jgi:DNA repair exonuclease SbcCD ATPase subunit
MYLQNLSVSGFRGIGDSINIPLSHRTILYGPNGSGKSSVLQSIAWALYGALPTFTGGVFVKEDALVNDFLDIAKTQVELTFSSGEIISRHRSKQTSTTRGINPLSITPPSTDPQSALEKIIGLNPDEFFAAVFLHQETIRDFLTTSPEKRSATIDRMIGTYLLRSLIKSVDPKIPDKAIAEAKADISAIESRLSSATVISREVIDRKKAEYGDPTTIQTRLEGILNDLKPLLKELGLPVCGETLGDLTTALEESRRNQMELVRDYTAQVGNLSILKQRYEQASDSNWEGVRKKREQYGDPADLSTLTPDLRNRLNPILNQFGLPESGISVDEIKKNLDAARRAQNIMVGKLTQETADLNRLKDQYHQAAVTDWQGLNERKSRWGDIQALPDLLQKIKVNLSPHLECFGIPIPQPTLSALNEGLTKARHLQPGEVSRLERLASDYLDLKTRYVQAKQNVIDLPVIPSELLTRQVDLDSRVKNLNSRIIELNKQIGEREALHEEIIKLQDETKDLQEINVQILEDQADLDRLEQQSQQELLYNQLLDIGQMYLEQSHPDHCPLCKQSIEEIDNVIGLIKSEIPADVEKLQKEIQKYKDSISALKDRTATLEAKQTRLNRKNTTFAVLPTDLEEQVAQVQKDRSEATELLTTVNAEIDRVKARISMAENNRRTMEKIQAEIQQSLGQITISDPQAALELATRTVRNQASDIKDIDFQPIVNQLDHAKQLDDMAHEEEQLQRRLQKVLADISRVIGPSKESDVHELLDNEILKQQQHTSDIQAIDYQPITTDLERAFQLQQILEEEIRLQEELDNIKAEVRHKLGLPDEQEDLLSALTTAILKAQDEAQKINSIDLRPIDEKLQRTRQIAEIAEDEEKLRSLEHGYQTAQREKNRLNYKISRFVELRNALHDISETTKRHQEVIVTEMLNNLDIGRYYKQLDPHPAYTELQIEPEPSPNGTYKYWIRARTTDFDHSAYVQARFSTAQANCAAIAIFLAVNQHLSKNLETVLLDDPSQSMDPDHKYRLAITLANHPRQVIVATEDPQMFSLLKDTFTSPVIYELQPWTTRGAVVV